MAAFAFILKNMMQNILLISTITCPVCGYQKEETMPTNAYRKKGIPILSIYFQKRIAL